MTTNRTRTGLYLDAIDEAVAADLAGLDVPVTMRVVAEYGALARHADARLREVVGNARRNGATWQQVGDALGVTRQAAQMRFGKADRRDLRACCDHPAHEPGRCEYFTAPRTDFPGSIERCDCDCNSPTVRV